MSPSRLWFLIAVLALCLTSPAPAARLKVLAPADRSLVRGPITFRIAPGDERQDQFLENPYIRVYDQAGRATAELRAVRDPKTQVCAASLDTTPLRDGQYQVTVSYRTLVGGKAREVRENLTLGVRNGPSRPARFTVSVENRSFKTSEAADLRVKVLDGAGRPMAGARVQFKASAGQLESEVEITDRDGEAFITLESEDAEAVMLTVTVEHLAPQMRAVRFVD